MESIKGVPSSQGVATGRVRVANNLEEAQSVQLGEILVAESTSPGWTPLFSLIAGIITEEGGVLSHSSVVAREFGIPAVIQIENATKKLKTGQVITIDGCEGKVVVHADLPVSGSK